MMVAGIKAYQDAGVDHTVLALNSGDVSALKRLIKTIANEVPPEFPYGVLRNRSADLDSEPFPHRRPRRQQHGYGSEAQNRQYQEGVFVAASYVVDDSRE